MYISSNWKGVVERVYTDLAILDIKNEGIFVREMAPNVDFNYLQKHTGAKLNQYAQTQI